MSNVYPMVDWAKGTNIYEVNIRQYTEEGNFRSFQLHLERLKEMGVKVLWFMPIYPISKLGRQGTLGSYYAISNYVEINPEFGNLDDFKDLVDKAHLLGFKVILDWVANHTGKDHVWTSFHPDWYKKDLKGDFTEAHGWIDVVDLDYSKVEMRHAMIKAMQYWIRECDIDGFRCDMAHLVPLDFWNQARSSCDSIKQLLWLGECENVDYHDVFDISYAWQWMHSTEKLILGTQTVHDTYNILHAYSQYPKDSYKLFFTSNHDENSWNGTEKEKYGMAYKTLAVFTCTWKGVPLIYSGQEIPNDKRLHFFEKDLINWHQPISLNYFYKTLLTLSSSPVIVEGETFLLPSNHDKVMVYLRRFNNETILVLLNFSSIDRCLVNVKHSHINGKFRNEFSLITYNFKGNETFELSKYDYLVFKSM